MAQFLLVAAFTAIILEQAHIVSPIALAWSKAGFRRHMLARPGKWLLWPALCLGVAVGVGLTSMRHSFAFTALFVVYLGWQVIHFSMQNYGLMKLWGARGWLAKLAGAATAVVMLFPLVPLVVIQLTPVAPVMAHTLAAKIPQWVLLGPWAIPIFVALTWGHWVTDIALSTSRSSRWWLFFAGILVVGAGGFLFKEVSVDPRLCQGFAACTAMYSAPFWLSLILGLSFVHYLYSRWVWQGPVRGLLAV